MESRLTYWSYSICPGEGVVERTEDGAATFLKWPEHNQKQKDHFERDYSGPTFSSHPPLMNNNLAPQHLLLILILLDLVFEA
jgi:hypothetical protein